MATKVEIVDDHVLFAEALGDLVRNLPGFEVVGIAASGEQAVSVAASAQPDVILLDYHLPGILASELLPSIRAASPRSKVIVLTSDTSSATRSAALSAGVDGFLTKEQALDDIGDALHAAIAEAEVPEAMAAPEPPPRPASEPPPARAPEPRPQPPAAVARPTPPITPSLAPRPRPATSYGPLMRVNISTYPRRPELVEEETPPAPVPEARPPGPTEGATPPMAPLYETVTTASPMHVEETRVAEQEPASTDLFDLGGYATKLGELAAILASATAKLRKGAERVRDLEAMRERRRLP